MKNRIFDVIFQKKKNSRATKQPIQRENGVLTAYLASSLPKGHMGEAD